jgi:PQQ-dependent dehydrogenase (methanol/ethanol family)
MIAVIKGRGIVRFAVLALLLLPLAHTARAQAAPPPNTGWAQYGNDYADTHYSPLAEVTTGNLDHLHLAYAVSVGTLRSNESTPLVIGDTMYVTSSWGPRFVYALDAATGAQKWRYKSNIPESVLRFACCDVNNRGVAYSEGKIFVGQLDGTLVALEAASGTQLWKSVVVDYKQGAVITSPPLVVGNKVITGFGGGEYGVRGYLSAYDAATGKQLWRTYMIPGPGEKGNETWKGDSWKHGGAAAWLVGSYDPKLNLIYYGTSNPSSWVASTRSNNQPNDRYPNLYSSSVVAINPDDGKITWHIQYTPADAWDYDGVNESVLVDLAIDGAQVPALVHADRNGFFYVADRRTGRLLSANPFVNVNWATGINLESGQPIEAPNMRPTLAHEVKHICPSAIGGKNWQPMSFSPDTGLVYLTANNLYQDSTMEKVGYHQGFYYMGVKQLNVFAGAGGFQGELIAWNPVTHTRAWAVPQPLWFNGGVLSTGGGLVFYGTFDGWFKAVDAKTGKDLWKFRVGSGVGAAPMTYAIDGKQYIAVVAGRSVSMPNWLGKFGAQASDQTPESGMLFVFAVD